MARIAFTELKSLEHAECLELLRCCRLGRLAVVNDEQPLVFPVNYVMHDVHVVFRTDPGTKLATAVDRRVAFEIDGAYAPFEEGWSVLVLGVARAERETSKIHELDRLGLRPWAPGGKDYWIRIEEPVMTGRRVVHVERSSGTNGHR
jgi:nitroimidazol reductase NimA-like FMN-containing flavoprotein (pyridoxamine 5'-phosphate oxidase superfamily)